MVYILKSKKYGTKEVHGDAGVNRLGNKEYNIVNARAGGTIYFKTKEDAQRYLREAGFSAKNRRDLEIQEYERRKRTVQPKRYGFESLVSRPNKRIGFGFRF